ncbi:MAG: hypothetical protein ACYC6R_09660 [Anaerolineales bacterium]
MNRLQFVLMLVFLLQACSMNSLFLPTSTPAPKATASVIYTPVDTTTPILTPTLTPSPTVVHIPTQDLNQPTPTAFIIPLFFSTVVTAIPFATPDFLPPGPGFTSVFISENRIYWGGCKYNHTLITAVVNDLKEIFSVIIFTRTKLMNEDDSTPWTSGNVMFNNRDGSFTYNMRGNDVKGTVPTRKSWVIFQLVATNIKGEEVGRTRIYAQDILLSPCMCYDPSTGCPPTVKPTQP